MAGPRSGPRPAAGPGRGSSRRTSARSGRSGQRPAERTGSSGSPAESSADRTSDTPARTARPRMRRVTGLTGRALALGVVLLVLALSYASSLRVYLDQRHDILQATATIGASQQDIENLSNEINRWNDPDYVKTQARERLGWVMPGETGYKVIGPDGQPLGGGPEIAGATPTTQPQAPWWRKLVDSLKKADQPAS